MATIDDKVVAMSFESSKFESGVNKTISSLDKLKAALHFPNAGKGLDDISAASKRVDLSHISNGVGAIKNALNTLRLVGIGVMANLASTAVRTGLSIAKSFSIGPAIAGFKEYSTNLNSIQTILANTEASGAGLKEVNAALDELNEYSDKTIYNFSQMARNIGTFTAAGVDLDTSTQAIKGIANLAALSGSNADQASTAMYQLSQAISAGRVGLQDWNSVVNAGMGGTVFQRALATTAENMGTLKEGTLKLVGPMKNVEIAGQSFRQSMQAGPGKTSWLTSKVLTTTLKQFTGDLTDAQLKADGFNAAQIKAIQQTAKTAQHAATEVKTISQVLDVAKETAGSGWAQTFRVIFGDFEEAKTTFTALSETINGFVNQNAEARNKVLGDWKKLGGRTVLIDTIKTAFTNLLQVLAPIKIAFRDIFPAATGKGLYDLTVRLQDFIETLKPGPETIENLFRTFRGLFAVMDIGKQVIQGIFTMFTKMFGAISGGSGGFLNFTAAIGDWLVKLDLALKKGDGINKFFAGLGEILSKPIELLGRMADALGDLFGGFDSGGISDKVGGATAALTPFQKVLEAVADAWDRLMSGLSGSGIFEKALNGIVTAIQGLGSAIGHAASTMNFEAIFAVIRTGLFAGLVLMFKKFFGKGTFLDQIGKGFGGGILDNISKSFDALRGSMEAMQTNIKADTLKKIAVAIGILVASIVALSFVDPDKLKSSLTAIGVAMGMLLGAMLVLEKVAISKGFLKMPFITAAMIGLAAAIDVLAIAVFALSKLSWGELLRGLTGVAALMAGLVVAMKPLTASSKGMIAAGIGITGIAIGMNIMALAMKQMAGMKWEEMAKGLAGVGGALLALSRTVGKMPAVGMVQMGVGIIALAGGLKLMASAMKDFAKMKWKDIGKGLAAVGGALLVVAGAMALMPGGMVTMGVGLIAVAYSLGLIGDALADMGGMSIATIAKGIGTLALTLSLLDAALYSMTGAIAGAFALTVAAAGIMVLAKALQMMGSMSTGEIITALITLAGAIIVLGAAAALLTPVVPSMLALGAALFLIGGGLALAGAGIFLVGAGLSAIAVAGPAAVGILVAAFLELQQGIIKSAKNLILGLLEIVEALADTAPKFVDAIIKIIESLLDAVIRSAPKVADAFIVVMTEAMRALRNLQPKLVQAGFDLLMALLKGIRNNIGQIVTVVSEIIVKFLDSLTKNLNKIIEAGVDLLIALIKGIAKNIKDVAAAAVDVIVQFITAIGAGYKDIIAAGVAVLVSLIKGIGQNAKDILAVAADIIVDFIDGLADKANDIVEAGVDAVLSFIEGLGKNAVELAFGAYRVILQFLTGLHQAISIYQPLIVAEAVKIGAAIITGTLQGLIAWAPALYSKAKSIAGNVIGFMGKAVGKGSPAKEAIPIGESIIQGFAKGLDDNAIDVYKSATVMSKELIQKFKDAFGIASPSKVMIEIGQAVGQGFAQGIKGSRDDIKQAFADLNGTLRDAMEEARETIASEQENLQEAIDDTYEKYAKLRKLRAEKKPDKEAIAEALKDLKESQVKIREIQAVILLNEDILKRTTEAHNTLIDTLKEEKKALLVAAGQYESITNRLEKAKAALDEIKKARRDLVTSTTEQYSVLPELSTLTPEEIAAGRKAIVDAQGKVNELLAANEQDEEAIKNARASVSEQEAKLAELLKGKILSASGDSVNLLATYQSDLKARTEAVAAYNKTLTALRASGIDNATYNKLVADGTADQQFATQLIEGGKKAISGVKALDRNLIAEAKKIGVNTGDQMFKAGQEVKQKLVNSLKDDQHDAAVEMRKIGKKMMVSLKTALREDKDGVGDEMESVGKEMIARMKKALGMKSPSREMIEIGKMSIEGLAQGLTGNIHLINSAADKVADNTLTAMQKSMSDIHSSVLNNIDANPVITPILDLSVIRGQSRDLANLIPANASYGNAAAISAMQGVSQDEAANVALTGPSVIFEQNNYSPTALSEIDIYRQTRNQMSQLKSVLAVT